MGVVEETVGLRRQFSEFRDFQMVYQDPFNKNTHTEDDVSIFLI